MNNTLKKGLKLFELLALSAKHHSVSQIARVLKLPKSETWRLLATMRDAGFIEQDEGSKHYRVTLKVIEMANATLRRLALRDKLRPYCQELSMKLKQPAYVTVRYERGPMVVDVEFPQEFRGDTGLAIGSVLPMHSSASGKVIAAHFTERELGTALRHYRFTQDTERTVATAAAFRRQFSGIRRDGVAVTDGERGRDVKAVAAPVFGRDGAVIGTIGVTLPPGKATRRTWERFKKATKLIAEAASYAIGYMEVELTN